MSSLRFICRPVSLHLFAFAVVAFAFHQGALLHAVPAPAAATPAASTNAPALATLVLRTSDGLPVEVELLGLHKDTLLVRHTSTQREATLNLLKQPKAEHDAVQAEVAKARLSAIRVDMRAQLLENLSPNGTEQIIQQKGRLSTQEVVNASTDVGAPVVRALPNGARCLRLHASVGRDVHVDIRADAYIFWYAKETSGKTAARSIPTSGNRTGAEKSAAPQIVRKSGDASIVQQEVIPLLISKEFAECISSPFAKGSYQAWAVIIVNRDNGEIIWKNGSGPLWDAENAVREIIENFTAAK
ncbi:MAG: hypothetical protein LBD01_06760 [Puniceicoccales bacterium]|jgi:hypothetical protein|nr:hypothetical protein [Puniceicoccales bacterium]